MYLHLKSVMISKEQARNTRHASCRCVKADEKRATVMFTSATTGTAGQRAQESRQTTPNTSGGSGARERRELQSKRVDRGIK